MSPIKKRLLEAIERTPEPLLEQTLAFLEFLTSRTQSAIVPDLESDGRGHGGTAPTDTDSNEQILADLKASLHQSGTNLPHLRTLGWYQCLIFLVPRLCPTVYRQVYP